MPKRMATVPTFDMPEPRRKGQKTPARPPQLSRQPAARAVNAEAVPVFALFCVTCTANLIAGVHHACTETVPKPVRSRFQQMIDELPDADVSRHLKGVVNQDGKPFDDWPKEQYREVCRCYASRPTVKMGIDRPHTYAHILNAAADPSRWPNPKTAIDTVAGESTPPSNDEKRRANISDLQRDAENDEAADRMAEHRRANPDQLTCPCICVAWGSQHVFSNQY